MFRYQGCSLLFFLGMVLLQGWDSTETEAQLFRGRLMQRVVRCSPSPCPDYCPAPSTVSLSERIVCQSANPKPVSFAPTDCDGQTCSFFYDAREGRWLYHSNDCRRDCYCELPIETGGGTSSTRLVQASCTAIPDAASQGFRLQLRMNNNQDKSFFFILPESNSALEVNKYQFEVIPGTYWMVEIIYDSSNNTVSIPIPSGVASPQFSRIKSFGISDSYQAEFDHSPGTGSSEATYQFAGYLVKVSRLRQ
jgi:hypothetical protein